MLIRPARAEDAECIADLNEVFVDVTSPMDAHRFLELFDLSSFCLVAEEGHELLGFVIAMRSGAPYVNANYQWFNERFDNMVYIDRIVLASESRGRGLGPALYEYTAMLAEAVDCDVMTAEMNIAPPNEHSLHFHSKQGFVELGQRTLDSGKCVSMQSVTLRALLSR